MALGFSCNANVQTFPQLPVASFHANHRHALPVFSMSTSRRHRRASAFISKGFTYRPAEIVNFNLSQDYNKKLEVFRFLGKSSNWARDNILPLLKPTDKCWQPQDFLPDPSAEDFLDQLDHLQEMNKELSDEYFVVLTGDMITEEALPTYVSAHKNTDAWGDEDTDWSVWTRGWTAEENRHGDLLSRYLYLSGRVDMKQVEKTIQYLIGSGMQFGIKYDPYSFAIYSSFQERATFLSHRNTAKLARRHGDAKLAQICGVIAADEKRHEAAYSGLTKKIFELDPDGAMVAFADMLRKKISMPAHLMYDGRDENLFANFSDVAARLGVYSLADYIDIAEHVMAFWNVGKLEGLSSKGKEAQDFICQCPTKLRRLLERVDQAKAKKDPKAPIAFSWIFNRQI